MRRQRLGALSQLVLRVGLPVERRVGLGALQLDHPVERGDGAIPAAGVERALSLLVVATFSRSRSRFARSFSRARHRRRRAARRCRAAHWSVQLLPRPGAAASRVDVGRGAALRATATRRRPAAERADVRRRPRPPPRRVPAACAAGVCAACGRLRRGRPCRDQRRGQRQSQVCCRRHVMSLYGCRLSTA